jgi:ribulose-phosphate 3-epimerase
LVAPSILAADFAILGSELARAERGGADIIHVDVMDGHFVPNISVGPPVVRMLRPRTDLTFDTHLMISNPENYVEAFAKAGANHITIHVETGGDVPAILERIVELGCSPGLCLKPGTPAAAIEPYLDLVRMVLVMTVEPGFGGQSFMHDMLPKIREVREMSLACTRPFWVEVDGGISPETAPLAASSGANVFVAGTSIFRNPGGARKAIKALRNSGGGFAAQFPPA